MLTQKKEGGIRLADLPREWDNKLPVVSVIMATYNADLYLEETLLSIKNQTYPNIELIIFDALSNDHTLNILEKYSDIIDYWKSEQDIGVYDAWNKALKVSSGKWITFIGSDDYFENTAISDYVEHILSLDFEPQFISSWIRLIKRNGDFKIIGDSWRWDKFQRYMNTQHVGTFHNRSLFDKFGKFNVNYKICADYEFLLRARESLITSFMPIITVNARIGGISNNNNRVITEAFTAKVNTGGRNYVLALMEYGYTLCTFNIKRIFFGTI